MAKIFVGKDSSGELNVCSFGNPKELLIIRNNVSIGNNVKFVLGGLKPEEESNGAIIIEDDVKTEENSIIFSEVTISQGTVVAKGANIYRIQNKKAGIPA